MISIKRLSIIMVVCGAVMAAHAGDARFTYVSPGDTENAIGSSQAKPYDVAIKLNGADFAGAKIKAVSVPVPNSENISNCKVWVSSALTLNGQTNVADIFEASATPSNGVLEYTFPAPIAITGDVYVGYSFEVTAVDDLTRNPVLTVDGKKDGALYVHGGLIWRTWKDVGSTYSMISRMTVTLTGDFSEADMALNLDNKNIAVATDAETIKIPATLTNYGTYGAKSVNVAYSFNGGATKNTSVTIDPEQTIYMAPNAVTITIPNESHLGDNTLDLTIDKVNVSANVNTNKSVHAMVLNLEEMPVYRPLVEEYTGLWCGYCPRGLAAMEYMAGKYPDEWIGVALHAEDNMAIFSGSGFPNSIGSFPTSVIDRVQIVDPYYGTSEDGSRTIEDDWLEWRQEFTPFILTVTAGPDAGNAAGVYAKATVKVVYPVEGDYRLFYYLVADGVHNDKFIQGNSYAGTNPAAYTIPEMRQYCEGSTYMYGMYFNDIPVMASAVKGIEGSLPASMAANTPYTHSYTFDTTGATSLKGYDMISTASQLNVVVGIADYATGKVVNSAKCKVTAEGGIGSITADRQVVSRQAYDLMGRPVDLTAPGIKIVRTAYSDGTVTTAKTR